MKEKDIDSDARDHELRYSYAHRSYRLSSGKLLDTGSQPASGVEEAIVESVAEHRSGDLREADIQHHPRTTKPLGVART